MLPIRKRGVSVIEVANLVDFVGLELASRSPLQETAEREVPHRSLSGELEYLAKGVIVLYQQVDLFHELRVRGRGGQHMAQAHHIRDKLAPSNRRDDGFRAEGAQMVHAVNVEDGHELVAS